MRASVEIITPHVAKEMLERMETNRPLSIATVTRYARDMKDGRWANNGQGIVLSEGGTLLDGQHRLKAIIQAQASIAMLVVRGADRKAFVTMDSGKARVLSDVLAIEGFGYTHNMAGIARATFAYISHASYNYNGTKAQLESFIQSHPYVAECAQIVGVKKQLCPKAPLGAVLFLANEKRQLDEEVASFLEGVLTGERLWKGDPRYTLREWLAASRIGNKRALSEHFFGAVGRAWNAYAAGKELSIIKMIDKPTQTSLPIFGFDPLLYGDVQDVRENIAEARAKLTAHGVKHRFGAKAEATPA